MSATMSLQDALKFVLDKRVLFVLADARTYIFVRMNGHLEKEDMGGGNFATAYAQFALISLLAKVHYFLDHPDKFATKDDEQSARSQKTQILHQLESPDKKFVSKYLRVPRDMEANEEDAFVHFVKYLHQQGVKLYEPRSDDSEEADARIIWKGFRNSLSHMAMIERGKGIQTFAFEEYWDWQQNSGKPLTTEQMLERVREKAGTNHVFTWAGSGWMMNIDILTSLLREIQEATDDHIDDSAIAAEQLKRLLLFIEPQN